MGMKIADSWRARLASIDAARDIDSLIASIEGALADQAPACYPAQGQEDREAAIIAAHKAQHALEARAQPSSAGAAERTLLDLLRGRGVYGTHVVRTRKGGTRYVSGPVERSRGSMALGMGPGAAAVASERRQDSQWEGDSYRERLRPVAGPAKLDQLASDLCTARPRTPEQLAAAREEQQQEKRSAARDVRAALRHAGLARPRGKRGGRKHSA